MKYFSTGHKESYTLIARKRHVKKLRQHQSNTTWHGTTTALTGVQQPPIRQSPDRLKGTTCDLFELLEKAQSSRLDDQRCVLPAYFNQVSVKTIKL
ncbi:Rap1 GTPase-activating protein 1-like Protein [Tribolium castaneum]|uniref:Rap1 GTPase-activating protein 1-like Protein n=1 Tax=Tribolium castaneum TaxID=7070 RepID=A0A139WDE8_TRICA|nr:Rap1 GTPase-activating protein 1-like Protein [Tribolium castaneum]